MEKKLTLEQVTGIYKALIGEWADQHDVELVRLQVTWKDQHDGGAPIMEEENKHEL